MFDFLFADDYENRKVDRYEVGDLFIDTASVNDGQKDYETAVEHPDYHDGKMIIVEAYDTKEEAQVGHNKRVKIMTTEPLPDIISDCGNSQIQQLGELFGMEFLYPRKRKEIN